jgi:hypothetical protein
MSHEEILAMIAPAQESGDLVMQWLQSELSSAKITQKGDYVTVEASVNEIEELLDADYNVFGIYVLTDDVHQANNCSQIWNQGTDSAHSLLQSSQGSQRSRRYGSADYLLRPQAAKINHF